MTVRCTNRTNKRSINSIIQIGDIGEIVDNNMDENGKVEVQWKKQGSRCNMDPDCLEKHESTIDAKKKCPQDYTFRDSWQVGSQVEIRDLRHWYKGIIIEMDGDKLTVEYETAFFGHDPVRTTKDFVRYGGSIQLCRESVIWWYNTTPDRKTPDLITATTDEIRTRIASGALTPETLVWCEGGEWKEIENYPELIPTYPVKIFSPLQPGAIRNCCCCRADRG